jgi:dTDP-4-amino-4,6-dideoxygalactose transaminase
VRLSPDAPVGRTELMRLLLADGIPTRRGVMAIHHERSYPGESAALTHTDAAAREVLMLPLFPDLTRDDQDYVIERLAFHVASRNGGRAVVTRAATNAERSISGTPLVR